MCQWGFLFQGFPARVWVFFVEACNSGFIVFSWGGVFLGVVFINDEVRCDRPRGACARASGRYHDGTHQERFDPWVSDHELVISWFFVVIQDRCLTSEGAVMR